MPATEQYGPVLLEKKVRRKWIDFNGHMNVAYYILLFDQAFNLFLDQHDLGQEYAEASNNSMFTLENHITYQHEVLHKDQLQIHFQLVDMDSKFIHYFLRLIHKEKQYLAASMEQISLHVDMNSRRPKRFLPATYDKLRATYADHKQYPTPRELGRSIGIRRPAPVKIQRS